MLRAEHAREHVATPLPGQQAASGRLRSDRLPWPTAAAVIVAASLLCWFGLGLAVLRLIG